MTGTPAEHAAGPVPSADRVCAIVVAGGEGRRFGRPKQFELVGGRRVLDWSLDAARSVAETVVLVLPASSLGSEADAVGADIVVAAGDTRSGSVRSGLAAVPEGTEIVVVHDAVRPLATPSLFEAVVSAVAGGADAAIPALPVCDTVKRVAGELVVETIDRSDLVAVQTPQAFRLELLRKAHAADPEATDDAGLVEALGGRVVVVAGDPRNIKITTASDLAIVEAWGVR